jgi:hypothetical protein
MAKKHYSKKNKTAIIEAAASARAEGKTWGAALLMAKKVGYRGSLQGISKMTRAVEEKAGKPKGKRRGRKPGPKPVIQNIIKRGPGRPRKITVAAAGAGSIEAMVAHVVRERVAVVLDKAIAVLQAARD